MSNSSLGHASLDPRMYRGLAVRAFRVAVRCLMRSTSPGDASRKRRVQGNGARSKNANKQVHSVGFTSWRVSYLVNPFQTLRSAPRPATDRIKPQRDPLAIDGTSSPHATTLRNLLLHWTADTTQPARGKTEGPKRCFDIALALLLGIPILPLAVMISIAVRAESPGPIFYHAVRVGKNGRLFRCIKYRSMYQDANVRLKNLLDADRRIRKQYEDHPKLRHDPRITAVGRILRRLSLDDLPQLWNVLKGDMSMIGPRPYNADEVPA